MPIPSVIDDFMFGDHALFEMTRRGVSKSEVAQVLANPGQSEIVRTGRAVYQSKFKRGAQQKVFLLRVFVDIDRHPPEVVTAYWTSKLEKYWR